MKKLLPIILVVAVVFTSCGETWQEYVYGEPYSFRVSFYKTPKISVESIGAFENDSLNTYIWENRFSDSDKHENSTYKVILQELPSEEIHSDSSIVFVEQAFDASQSEYSANPHFELKSSNTEEQNGYPGKTYRWHNKEHNVYLEERVFLVKNKMFRIVVVAKNGMYPNESMSRFFNSFVLTDEPGTYSAYVETGSATYSVDFPSTPEIVQRVIDTEAGKVVSNVALLEEPLDDDHRIAYSVNEALYGPELHEEVSGKNDEQMSLWFDDIIEGASSSIDGIVTMTKTIELDGLKGKEARISVFGGEYVAVYRVFYRQRYLYIVSTITHAGMENDQRVRLFLNSFKINN